MLSTLRFWSFRTSARLRIIISIMIGVVIAFAATVGAGNFMAIFQIYLGFVLFFIIPWSVINLTDFYILKRNSYAPEEFMKKDGRFRRLNYRTMATYLFTILCQLPFINTDLYQGPLSKMMSGLDIAWIVGIIVAFSCYAGFAKLRSPVSAEEMKDVKVVGTID